MTNSTAARRPFYSRPLVWIIALIAIAVLVAGALVGTKLYTSSQNTAAPTEFANEDIASGSGGADGAAGSIAGQWTIGEGSEAGYRVDEVLNGEDVTVVGRTPDVTGDITIDGSELTAGTVSVDLRTVTTDSSRRDNYFSGQAIDTNANPEATFTATGPVDLTALSDSGSAEIDIPGTLEINGQTQEATAQTTATRADTGLSVVGAIDVTWQDYGVEPPNLGFVSVEDAGVVEFSLALTQG
ncbi:MULTISPECIES: YceI family protein [Brevibacterium]|uniref:YceI family protein n=1 Tax=Brevibacterium casei TaxID=33889 RepID=A0A7T4DJK2_9MICO|nr:MULTISPECIES: YceI family protein [Brevibacterium]QQB14466.1 YceI family protein [Brevibacterium casei]